MDKEKQREKYLWNNFRLTPEDWERVFLFQKGVCAVCGFPQPPTKKGPRRLAVDHSHDTGESRSLLCSRCNPLLGRLENAFKRYGLHKLPGISLLLILKGLLRVLEDPPVRLALGRVVIGYPGKTGTNTHRAWIRETLGLPKKRKKRKKRKS